LAVTVNLTGLLLFMLGATDTTKQPDVAPDGIVTVMDDALQKFTITGEPFNVTKLLPCVDPKFDPSISTWLATSPVVAERIVIAGARLVEELRETLSKVAESVVPILLLDKARPTYTLLAMLIVLVVPACTQFTPSDAT
jgi:hypothetical protein